MQEWVPAVFINPRNTKESRHRIDKVTKTGRIEEKIKILQESIK